MTFNLVPLKSPQPPLADLMSSGLSEVYSRQRKAGPQDNNKGTVLTEGVLAHVSDHIQHVGLVVLRVMNMLLILTYASCIDVK